ncbi:hypothetical protein CVIRNUC_011008 [Coccomyxa viridis]|uniref:Uncharacterized protein n=1 Tax=Coccomyxa viridis TaxID=1274662 RepID=A0AAV1IKD0_9CHLO|nr:hypothetical protein CVIRNUC_011008 [Coccomyxa viridis]
MTHILAAPDFARGGGFFADVQEVARSVWAVGRRLYPCSATSEGLHETVQHLLSCGVSRRTARHAIATAKKEDPECSDPTYILIGWRQERLDALNKVWGAADPAAFVRDALIASGMTETERPHVLSVSDADLPSTRLGHKSVVGKHALCTSAGQVFY